MTEATTTTTKPAAGGGFIGGLIVGLIIGGVAGAVIPTFLKPGPGKTPVLEGGSVVKPRERLPAPADTTPPVQPPVPNPENPTAPGEAPPTEPAPK